MKGTVPPTETLRRWTREEYDRLVELGAFQSGERLELLDGFLILREPQSARHAAAIRRVVAALRRALGDGWQIDSQLPIALDPASEPERAIVEVHREPEPSETARYRWRYASVETLRPPATITPLLAPTTALIVADLLP